MSVALPEGEAPLHPECGRDAPKGESGAGWRRHASSGQGVPECVSVGECASLCVCDRKKGHQGRETPGSLNVWEKAKLRDSDRPRDRSPH